MDRLDRRGQHLGRVAAPVCVVRVGKHLADVTQGGRSQHRVGHGVQQHVGVAMAEQPPVVRHVDTTQSEDWALLQAMGIVPDSNMWDFRGSVLQ